MARRRCRHHPAYNEARTQKYCVRCGIPMFAPRRRRKYEPQHDRRRANDTAR